MVPQEQPLRVQNESILFIIMTSELILNPLFEILQKRTDQAGPWVRPYRFSPASRGQRAGTV